MLFGISKATPSGSDLGINEARIEVHLMYIVRRANKVIVLVLLVLVLVLLVEELIIQQMIETYLVSHPLKNLDMVQD